MKMSWDLEVLFQGGSASPQFAAFMQETTDLIAVLLRELQNAGDAPTANDTLDGWTDRMQSALSRIREADAFVSCLSAQQMNDQRAIALTEKLADLSAEYRQVLDLYDARLAKLDDASWRTWADQPKHTGIAFALNERREASRAKLPPALERVAGQLSIDGYQGWGEHYNTIVSRMSIPWEGALLSIGQAANKLEDPDPVVRAAMSEAWEQVWAEQDELCADTLNRIAGFRLKLYGLRGWNNALEEPLRLNRMSADTLQAMWQAVEEGVAPLKRYLALKAELLGKDKLGWHDVDAPIAATQTKIAYADAASLIADAFEQFSPNMANLARTAFAEHWIEAEDREGKRPGGFCTSFPLSRASRIFMTYSGTPGNVSTLAHELGHAYHSALVEQLPPLSQEYAMNVAETASTFAEAIVSDALLRQAESREEKLALLDERLQRAVAFLMNIRARFLFETRFYEQRANGFLSASELGERMVAAQRDAYGDCLGSWHPHFWASKLHFYLTDVPFYNFPYTFGYLFSTGLMAIADKEGPDFRVRYDALLRDTGAMTVEQLGQIHLGVSLDKPEFWREAVARAVSDVDQFVEVLASSN